MGVTVDSVWGCRIMFYTLVLHAPAHAEIRGNFHLSLKEFEKTSPSNHHQWTRNNKRQRNAGANLSLQKKNKRGEKKLFTKKFRSEKTRVLRRCKFLSSARRRRIAPATAPKPVPRAQLLPNPFSRMALSPHWRPSATNKPTWESKNKASRRRLSSPKIECYWTNLTMTNYRMLDRDPAWMYRI